MTELKQISLDGIAQSQRLEVQFGTTLESIKELTKEMKGFAEFKTTGQTIIGLFKWLLTGILTATVAFVVMIIGSVKESAEVRSAVNQQADRVKSLEQATTKLQEATSGNVTVNRTLAENLQKSTNATEELVASMKKEKPPTPVKVEFARVSSMTARFLLTSKSLYKTQKDSLEFRWELPSPIERDKVEKTRVSARLTPASNGFESVSNLANIDVQLRAGLTPDGRLCSVTLFTDQPDKIAESLKTTAKIPVEIMFTIPD